MISDGLVSEQIETNIKLITNAYRALKYDNETFVGRQMLDVYDVNEHIHTWLTTSLSLNRTVSYVAVVCLEGINYDHAILLLANQDTQTLQIKVIDPLPEVNDMFKQKADELISDLNEHFGDNIVQYIYSGRQCKESATYGDMSLIMLQEMLEKSDTAEKIVFAASPVLPSHYPSSNISIISLNDIEGMQKMRAQ